MKVSVNGRMFDDASTSLLTQGFLRGDGVFETMRVREGRIEFARGHVNRLIESATALDIPFPWDDRQTCTALRQVVTASGDPDLILRLVAARGGDEGPAVVLIVPEPFIGFDPRPMTQGFRLRTCSFPRNERSPLARHKTLSYLEPLTARAEARRAGADESLVLNTAGRVAGAATANIFFVREGVVVTPSIEEGAFPGIVRGAVLLAAKHLGYVTAERPVTPEELRETPEVFITSSRIGLAPVASIDGVPLPDPVRREASIPFLRMRVREMADAQGDPGTATT
jgi:branched-subunit amino acid aminotransferase/4-amino-4-deoxychorismate lyase